MQHLRLTRAVLAAALVAACGGEGPGGDVILSVSYDPATTFEFAELTWTPADSRQPFSVERRVVPGPFEPVDQTERGAQRRTVQLAYLPEVVDLEFRIVGLYDPSRVSNTVQLHRGIRPPQAFFAAFSTGGGPTDVHWINSSVVADTLVLERRTLQFDGSAGEWTPLPVAFSTGSGEYHDNDFAAWVDGARFEYRMYASKGAERSAIVDSVTEYADLKAPLLLDPTPLPNGIRLAFANQSRYATTLEIMRESRALQNATQVAVVPATATTYDDLVAPGTYIYWIIAHRPHPTLPVAMKSQATFGIGTTMLPEGSGLVAAVVDVGPGIVAARANGRQFATAGFLSDLSSTSPPFYVAPGAGASQAFRLPDGAIGYGPGIVTDRAGHPHTLYTAGQPFGSQPFDPVVHAWHDGTAWQTEEIAGAARYSPVRFDIGLDGTLHGTWFNGISTRAVASLVNGSWTIDSLTNQGGGTVELSGDETGAVHLVLQGNAGLEYWRRTTSGWTSEAVPSTSGFLREWHVFASTGQVTVVCRLDSADSNQMIVTAVTRTSAGWSSVETVAALPWQGQNFAASRSPDGLRIGIVSKVFQQTGVDGYLWVRSASGTVERHWYGTDGAVSTGFTADGRAWVLDALRDRIVPPTETAQVTLFEEP